MSATPDLTALKARMKSTWEAGDYTTFSSYMEPGAVDLLAAWNVVPGESLLDVACGSGQLAIPAARMGLEATGIDIASNLVKSARKRAAAENLLAVFHEGDAERLPYGDGAFDVVASIFGAMFAPRPDRVASELRRVCRPGGRILMGNWTPESFPARMFGAVAAYVSSPDVPSPLLWGQDAVVRERFPEATDIRTEKRLYTRWTYPFPVSDVVEFFWKNFGPLVRARDILDEEKRDALHQDLLRVFESFDRGENGTTQMEGEFLSVEVIH